MVTAGAGRAGNRDISARAASRACVCLLVMPGCWVVGSKESEHLQPEPSCGAESMGTNSSWIRDEGRTSQLGDGAKRNCGLSRGNGRAGSPESIAVWLGKSKPEQAGLSRSQLCKPKKVTVLL